MILFKVQVEGLCKVVRPEKEFYLFGIGGLPAVLVHSEETVLMAYLNRFLIYQSIILIVSCLKILIIVNSNLRTV
jgi:hypothetical protein